MRNCAYAMVLAACLLPALAFGQTDTVDVPDFFTAGNVEGTLNSAVNTAISGGTLSNTVFRLQPFGLYVLNATITVPAGQQLNLYADPPGATQQTAPPMICWTPSDIDRTYNFNCYGDINFKNIWILYATTNTEGLGTQVGTALEISEDTTDNKNVAVFENVIIDYANIGSGGGAVTVSATHASLSFTDCYFRNLTDTHYRYYGRPVSFRFNTQGYHIDKAIFENCTFANVGYVYMQEGAPVGEYTDTLIFNHCTFLNSVMFTLESGWWNWLAVTNSVFVNAFMFGHMGDSESIPAGGALNIDSVSAFGFAVPFTDGQRHILFANNSYFIEQWLIDYYQPGSNFYSDTASAENLPQPMPMMSAKTKSFFDPANKASFPYMTMMNVYDYEDVGATANPGFLIPPTNQEGIKGFLVRKWTDNSDTTWAFDPNSDINQIWPLNEQLRYSNTTLRTGGMGGFPLGDVYRWWKNLPSIYTNWKAQRDAEYAYIWDVLTNGVVGVEDEKPGIPEEFELSQNFPNPFNPMTEIGFSMPQRGLVSLKVYNMLGMEVATLVSGMRDAGRHYVTFDASTLSSGIYFYRLEAGSVTASKKMAFIK